MMRKFYTILCIFISYCCFGQISTSPEQITLTGNPTEELITFKFDLTNSGSDDVMLYWKLTKAEGFPTEWATQVCDFELCYGENVDQINIELPNTLVAGETKDFKIYLLPNNSEGTADLTFTLYDDNGLSNQILNMSTDKIQVSNTTTSSNKLRNEELKIYPNPTHNYFSISNDQKVAKIKIYSILNKEIMELSHSQGQTQNIESLYHGIYLVRLFDKNNSPLKAMRIQKK